MHPIGLHESCLKMDFTEKKAMEHLHELSELHLIKVSSTINNFIIFIFYDNKNAYFYFQR